MDGGAPCPGEGGGGGGGAPWTEEGGGGGIEALDPEVET
jgi:hypothetical protein